ncbi:MAG: hypothetical protein QM723_40305 [Myxococcaceae bacterium]
MNGHLIDRFQKRIHVPVGQLARAAELDQALDHSLDALLEAALEREGIRPDEQVCIDRLAVSLQLSAREGAAQLGASFARAFAQEVVRRLDRGDPTVVRYRSAAALLTELLVEVSRRELRRAWAWRAAGFWPPHEPRDFSDAAGAVLLALAKEPRLAAAVLAAHPDPAAVILRAAPPPAQQLLAAELALNAWPQAAVRRWLQQQPAAEQPTATLEALAPRLRAAVERAARSARGSISGSTAPLSSALLWLSGAAPEVLAQPQPVVERLLETLVWVDAAAALSGAEPARATAEAMEPPAASGDADANSPAAAANRTFRWPRERAGADESPPAPLELREGSLTQAGGLLFLLHLVRDCELPRRWQEDERFAALSFAELLHPLALTLRPHLEANDAAALAFAGLSPQATPPGRAAVLEDGLALRRWRDELLAALEARLARHQVPTERSGEALLSWVVQRRAVVRADPGWLELELSLDDVSTELRRAGLDLDLGWLPFLGVVVRFTYA